MREAWSKIRRILGLRRALHDDLDEEMRAHLALLADDNAAQGMNPEQARLAAKKNFGNPTAVRELAHDAWRFPVFENFLDDARHALRGLRKSPAFALAVIATLALGIGANTAIFSTVYAVLLRPLPYPHGERLAWLAESNAKASGISVTWINFQHWRAESRAFEDMAGFQTADLTLTGRGQAVLTHAGLVTRAFFPLTGSRPLLGRLFTEADDRPGSAPTVVVTEEFWAHALGADPHILGETLVLNGEPYQIVGVLAPGLKFFSRPIDFYLPLGRSTARIISRSDHGSMRAIGLLKPGVTLSQARQDLDTILRRLALSDPGPEDDHRSEVQSLSEIGTGDFRRTLLLLMAAAALVLLLSCANVASLLLVRGASRAREMAIRAAIGAGQSRLVRQLLTEALLLASLGGALGLLLAGLCLRTLVRMAPPAIPRLSEAGLDLPALLFATAVAVLAGLLAGVAPVFASRKLDLTAVLKDGSQGAGGGRRGHSLRGALVVAEIAVTLVLSFSSVLLIRSLILAQTAYSGFHSDRLLALELQLPPSSYKTDAAIREFYDRLTFNLLHTPGVASAGAVNCPPSAGDCGDWWYSIPGQPTPSRGDVPLSLFNTADPEYFHSMEMPLLAGRAFNSADRENGPPVAIVNQTFARTWWPSPRLALGQRIKLGGPYRKGPIYEIVGVAPDVSQMGLDSAPLPEIYFPFSQHASSAMVVMIRTTGAPDSLIPAVRRLLAATDRNLPIQSLRPFETWLGATLDRRRFGTLLLASFAALAMILAAVGIHGVLSEWAGIRRREIALRMALGARRSVILRWAAWHALRLLAAGLALGAFGVWAASRSLESQLFGVSAQSPSLILAAAAVVVAIAALAAGFPLWRVTRVDPASNLRDA